MATVVPFASCYAVNSMRPLRLFRGPGGYLSLLAHQGPRGAPRTRVVYHGPRMTLRQICRMLQALRQVGGREAAGAATRKQESALPCPSPQVSTATDKRCFPGCPRHRHSSNVKRAG